MAEDGDNSPTVAEEAGSDSAEGGRFPDLEELQREVERRIRDNQRFIERFMNEGFEEDERDEES